MNLEDLKDNFKSQLAQSWARIEDTSTYNQLKDRFENMTPASQKLTLIGIGAFIALMVLSIPYSYYNQASDNVAMYEDKRGLIRELLKVAREVSEVPDIPPAPPVDSLRSTIENQLRGANLLPEQMKGIETMEATTHLIPKSLIEAALKVSLAKLNLRQIVDIGFSLQNISPSVKMSDLHIHPNVEDSKYFDVEFRMVTLAVPQPQAAEAPEEEAPAKGGGAKKPFKRGDR